METVPSADGTEIAFKRTGDGPPLVLVHGAGLDHSFWELGEFRSGLAEHYTVYTIDRRGRGASGDADAYDLQHEVEDVVSVVESIDRPVTLLGHSFGALIALDAADRIDSLHALVLYEPGISFEEGFPVIEKLLGTIQPLIANGENEQALLTFLKAVGTPESSLEELRTGANWQGLVDAADTLPREFGQIIEYEFEPERFREVTTPTLLVVGKESSPGAIDTTKVLNETFPASQIARIGGANHFGLISKPDRCIEELLSFRQDQ